MIIVFVINYVIIMIRNVIRTWNIGVFEFVSVRSG